MVGEDGDGRRPTRTCAVPRAPRACKLASSPGSTICTVSATSPLRVLVYSDNAKTRQDVMLALGKRVHPDLPELSYVEVATGPVVIQQVDAGGIDLAILDGEATPEGGMGIAKQLKDEIDAGTADRGADRPPRRRLAGQLVTRRGRGPAPDRPDPAEPDRARVAAHPRCSSRPPDPERTDSPAAATAAESARHRYRARDERNASRSE